MPSNFYEHEAQGVGGSVPANKFIKKNATADTAALTIGLGGA